MPLHNHDGSEYRIPCQSRFFGRSRYHDRHNQCGFNNSDGEGEDKRAEWLADAVGNHLRVIHGRENGGDQDRPCGSGNEAARAGKGRYQ